MSDMKCDPIGWDDKPRNEGLDSVDGTGGNGPEDEQPKPPQPSDFYPDGQAFSRTLPGGGQSMG